MIVVPILVLFLLVAALSEAQRRSRKQIASLERTQLIDPSTLLGTPYALERELQHALALPEPFSCAELQINDARRAGEAVIALRSICLHGTDLVFCLDLSRGSFLLLTYGTLDPARVASYFAGELRSYGLVAKIGWAYTRSADPAIRSKVRSAAQDAVARVSGLDGVEVALVDPDEWPADDKTQRQMPALRQRRESLCLEPEELARLAGITEVALRHVEEGRACSVPLAAFITKILDIVEASTSRFMRRDERTPIGESATAKIPLMASSPQARPLQIGDSILDRD